MSNRELANNLVQKICSELQIVPSELSWKKMVDVAEQEIEAAQHNAHQTPPTSRTDIALGMAEIALAKQRARKAAGG